MNKIITSGTARTVGTYGTESRATFFTTAHKQTPFPDIQPHPIDLDLDSTIFNLWLIGYKAEKKRFLYWDKYQFIDNVKNCVAIFLIIVTACMSGAASYELGSDCNDNKKTCEIASWFILGGGIVSAFLTSINKIYKYPERAEQSKFISKSYGVLNKRIHNFLFIYLSNKHSILSNNVPSFEVFLKQVQDEETELINKIEDIPNELKNWKSQKNESYILTNVKNNTNNTNNTNNIDSLDYNIQELHKKFEEYINLIRHTSSPMSSPVQDVYPCIAPTSIQPLAPIFGSTMYNIQPNTTLGFPRQQYDATNICQA